MPVAPEVVGQRSDASYHDAGSSAANEHSFGTELQQAGSTAQSDAANNFRDNELQRPPENIEQQRPPENIEQQRPLENNVPRRPEENMEEKVIADLKAKVMESLSKNKDFGDTFDKALKPFTVPLAVMTGLLSSVAAGFAIKTNYDKEKEENKTNSNKNNQTASSTAV